MECVFRRLLKLLNHGPYVVRQAERVVLPALVRLSRRRCSVGLAETLQTDWSDRPTLAFSRFQLLAEGSDESPGVRGLGCIEGRVVRIPDGQLVPQLGWNRVEFTAPSGVADGHAYFANSYCLPTAPSGWSVARTNYGISMVSAIQRGAVLGCQFHPELCGRWGHTLLQTWLSKGGVPC